MEKMPIEVVYGILLGESVLRAPLVMPGKIISESAVFHCDMSVGHPANFKFSFPKPLRELPLVFAICHCVANAGRYS